MNILNYLKIILSRYSNFENNILLRAGIILAVVILLLELVFYILIRKISNKEKLKPSTLIISFIQGFRIFLRFMIVYLFLRGIKSPEDVTYPVNIIYRGLELAILYIGLIFAILKTIKLLKKMSIDLIVTSKLKKKSQRGLNIIVILLVLSMYISSLKREFAQELQTGLWLSLIIIVNSILLMVALFFVVEKFLPQIQKFLKEHSSSGLAVHFVSLVKGPLKIFIITIFLLSIKPVITEQAKLIDITSKLIEITFSAAIILILFNITDIVISRLSKFSELETNSLDKTLIEMIRMVIKISFLAVFCFIAVRIFSGKPLTTILAGLGIGGLAVALAAQDTLKNFFGSIMIMTDRPFKVGERIVAEGYDGVIESIGFRSTRIRTLTGNQVVIPNDKVAQAGIENIGRRATIRRLTNITITYNTSPEKVEKALAIIREILDNHEGMIPDFPPRVNFSEFNADSLNILVLYWYSPPNYWEYMRFSEEVNLKIMKGFAAEGIEFAFPTQTTYLEQEDGKSIKLDITGSKNSYI